MACIHKSAGFVGASWWCLIFGHRVWQAGGEDKSVDGKNKSGMRGIVDNYNSRAGIDGTKGSKAYVRTLLFLLTSGKYRQRAQAKVSSMGERRKG